jgi:hypothetical protein
MVILVHCFSKGFLIKLSQLYFKQSAAEAAFDLFPPEGWGIDRGRKRILYLLVVDENGYDLFRPEG